MKTVYTILCVMILGGCASTELSRWGRKVRIVASTPGPECKYMGEVVGTPGGMTMTVGGQAEAARADLKNRAGHMGANLVEVTGRYDRVMGSSIRGEAYWCDRYE